MTGLQFLASVRAAIDRAVERDAHVARWLGENAVRVERGDLAEAFVITRAGERVRVRDIPPLSENASAGSWIEGNFVGLLVDAPDGIDVEKAADLPGRRPRPSVTISYVAADGVRRGLRGGSVTQLTQMLMLGAARRRGAR